MAVVKTIMKKTHQEAIVKVAGTAAAATIDLSADLVAAGQVLDGDVQKASITGVTWTGAPDGVVTITRNGVVIMTLQAGAVGMLYFDGQTMIPDNIEEASDLVVTISGAQSECWLKLRKISGYKTTVEPEQFGSYDNPAVAGS
jgi:hypothetical protein